MKLLWLLFLVVFVKSSESVCNLPPDFWCDHPKIALECTGSLTYCDKYKASRAQNPLKLRLAFEAGCPDSQQFVLYRLYPQLLSKRDLIPMVDFKALPWGLAKRDYENRVKCHHGAKECAGNRLLSCAMYYYLHNPEKSGKMFNCFMSSMVYKQVPETAMRACLERVQTPAAAVESITHCASGSQADDLQKLDEIETSKVLSTPRFVPFIAINDRSHLHMQAYQMVIGDKVRIWNHSLSLIPPTSTSPSRCQLPPDFWCTDPAFTQECYTQAGCSAYAASIYGKPIQIKAIYDSSLKHSVDYVLHYLKPHLLKDPKVQFEIEPTPTPKCGRQTAQCQEHAIQECVASKVKDPTDRTNILLCLLENKAQGMKTAWTNRCHYLQKTHDGNLKNSVILAKPEERQPVVLPINAHALHESSEFARSLLDDINEEVTQFKTPVKDSDYVVASGDGGRLVHSLSNYRRNEAYVTPVINTAVSTSDVVYALNASKNIEAINRMLISEHEIEKKRKMLGEKVTIYYSQINQMQSALLQVRRDSKKYDLNTEVEVLQQLTVAHLRRNGCYMETNKLQDMKELYYLIPRASIQFSKIAVNLVRHLLPADNCFVFVFVVIRHEEHVYATETRCVNDLLQRGVGVVEFCNSMTIDDVSPDFTFVVDVYGVNINYKDQKQDKKTIFMKILHSPAPDRSTTRQGPDQFSRLGSATITAAEFKRSSDHVLQGVEYPVEGKVVLKYSCKVTDSDPSNWTGLISIYRVVDGRGAWEHSFGRICNGRFSFWRYPEDVDVKEPILSFYIRDMACQAVATTSERVGFQYDFVLKIVDSKDSVVSIMLSTSEESERDRVLHIVNQSYKFTNTWSQF